MAEDDDILGADLGDYSFDDILRADLGDYSFGVGHSMLRRRNLLLHTSRVEHHQIEHCCIPIRGMVESDQHTSCISDTPDFVFTPKYLIVTTSGFFIQELRIGNIEVLYNTDADVFYRANWDRLERLGELDRVVLRRVKLTPSTKYTFLIRQHFGIKPREFRGAFIGESVAVTWV